VKNLFESSAAQHPLASIKLLLADRDLDVPIEASIDERLEVSEGAP
jgi:hypothetical protein